MRKFFSVLAIVGVVILSPSDRARATEIIAHRGASFDAPENTLAAFKLGYEQNADADELDIHLTKDGKVVVMHDPNTKRTGGVDKKILDQTLDEVRAQNVGNFGKWQGKGFNEKAPTLDEALALVPKGKRLFIEIKVHAEIVPALGEVLKRAPTTPDQTPIITFQYDAAEASKKAFPDRQVYFLSGSGKDKKTGEIPKVDDLIKKAKAAKLDGLDLEYKLVVDAATVQRVKAAGLKLYVWTVDDPEIARRLAAFGVDGITTNKPAELRKALGAAGK